MVTNLLNDGELRQVWHNVILTQSVYEGHFQIVFQLEAEGFSLVLKTWKVILKLVFKPLIMQQLLLKSDQLVFVVNTFFKGMFSNSK